MEKLKILSLFSGIGGFEVGLSISNLSPYAEVTQFVEVNPFCQHVLNTRFPGAAIASDIHDFNAQTGQFDIVVGGVPCQPFSLSGAKKGYTDNKNLFPEYFRVIRQAQPRYAIFENVQGLLSANHGQMFRAILYTFSKLGYDAEWGIIGAGALGGIHRRNRLFLLAQRQNHITDSDSLQRCGISKINIKSTNAFTVQTIGDTKQADVADSQTSRWYPFGSNDTQTRSNQAFEYKCDRSSKAIKQRLNPEFVEHMQGFPIGWTDTFIGNSDLPYPQLLTQKGCLDAIRHGMDYDEIPCRKERLCSLGNAVVPQCVRIVWNRIYNKEFGVI